MLTHPEKESAEEIKVKLDVLKKNLEKLQKNTKSSIQKTEQALDEWTCSRAIAVFGLDADMQWMKNKLNVA